MTDRDERVNIETTVDPSGRALKQKRAVRTRSLILSAAAEAFANQGFPGVTVADVAKLTGMTKGAVYFHYTNKEALAVAVTEEFYSRLPRIADRVQEMNLAPLQAVREILIQTAIAFRDEKVIQAGARLQIEHHLIGAPLPTPFLGFTGIITELFRQARSAGQLPSTSRPEALARVLVSAFFGAQHISWVQSNRADLISRTEETIDVIVGPLSRRADEG
jgi:AcrR family transcriptional regulator